MELCLAFIAKFEHIFVFFRSSRLEMFYEKAVRKKTQGRPCFTEVIGISLKRYSPVPPCVFVRWEL